MKHSKTKYRKDIQVLRGLAVLAVLLFHADASLFPLGYLGVDVFFVISGFVVTPLILRIPSDSSNRNSTLLSGLSNFYKRRFFRLAPALTVSLVFSAILVFLLLPPTSHSRFARQGIATLLFLGNLGAYEYSGDYFHPNPNPLIHTWSLSVEEQIYFALPLILLPFLRSINRKVVFYLLAFITVFSFTLSLGVIDPIYSRLGIENEVLFSFYSPINRIWQFTLGGLGFLIQEKHPNLLGAFFKRTNLVFVITLFMVLFGSLELNYKNSPFVVCSIALIVILSKSLCLMPKGIFKKLEWLGYRSYSIYLVHMPLISTIQHSPINQLSNDDWRKALSFVALIFSIWLGALIYLKVENIFRGNKSGKIVERKTFWSAVVLFPILPLVLFVIMDAGSRSNYWGLSGSNPPVSVGWDQDPNCDRMSELYSPCLYQTQGSSRTVLLIGDSHAGHLSQAMVNVAKSENWDLGVWTQADCLVQFEQDLTAQVSIECLKQNNRILNWVNQMKPDLVIISQYVKSDSSQIKLREALSVLQSRVRNVLYIENSPVFPRGRFTISNRPIIVPESWVSKVFSRTEMMLEDKKASDELANWARRNGISTMDFTSLFCTNQVCTRYANGKWLYADEDHFSLTGADLAIPQLSDILNG